MTTAKDRALITNTQRVPISAIRIPAMAGPISRAALRERMFSPAAFGISGPPTSSVTNESRAGFSTVKTQPRQNARV